MLQTQRFEGTWSPFLLAFGPVLVGIILMNVLARIAPDYAHLALPGAVGFLVPPLLTFARLKSVRYPSGAMAILSLYYGWMEPEDGEYGTWQMVPFVLLLSALCSLSIRYLPRFSSLAAIPMALIVSVYAFGHLRDPFIFPLGFVILGGLLVLKPRPEGVSHVR